MSFNRWQKLIAASTENAVVAARCEAKAGEALTSLLPFESSAQPSRAPRSTPSSERPRRRPIIRSVAHLIEPASSGRAKCRSCDQAIAKGELRFGERQPNAFGEGEMTLWFHLPCAAYSRPEPFLETQAAVAADGMEAAAHGALTAADAAPLVQAARFGIEHRRVPRLHGAARATSGRAHCRSCRELIGKGDWRLSLVFFEDYRFSPGGYVHAHCARAYFETVDLLERIRHFSKDLRDEDIAEIAAAMAVGRAAGVTAAPADARDGG